MVVSSVGPPGFRALCKPYLLLLLLKIKKHNPLAPVCVHACLHACMMSKQRELDLTDIGKKLANAQSKEALMNLLPVILPKSFLLSFLERTQFSFPEHTTFLTAITKFFLSLMLLLFVVSISRVPVIPTACWLGKVL